MNKKGILSLLMAGALVATPLSVNAATDFGGTVTSFGNENGRVTLSLIPVGSTEAVQTVRITGNENIYVMEGVQNGEYILRASKYNHGTREYQVTVDGSELTQDVALNLLGDISGDGKINLMDVSAVMKYIAKWDVELTTEAADVTGDGKINLMDVSLIMKYIAKWDVVLGK